MSEMVERVARILFRQARGVKCPPASVTWRDYEADAKELIEAMIEPTDNMLARGSAAAEVCDDGWETNATWMAMINAAVDGQGAQVRERNG